VSTLTEQPIGATIAIVMLNVASFILDSVPQVGGCIPYLLTHWWMSFGDLLRQPIALDSLRSGVLSAAAYALIFFSPPGPLRAARHHQLNLAGPGGRSARSGGQLMKMSSRRLSSWRRPVDGAIADLGIEGALHLLGAALHVGAATELNLSRRVLMSPVRSSAAVALTWPPLTALASSDLDRVIAADGVPGSFGVGPPGPAVPA